MTPFERLGEWVASKRECSWHVRYQSVDRFAHLSAQSPAGWTVAVWVGPIEVTYGPYFDIDEACEAVMDKLAEVGVLVPAPVSS